MLADRGGDSDAEVRWEDQQNINEFGRLNDRLHEVRDEQKLLKVRGLLGTVVPMMTTKMTMVLMLIMRMMFDLMVAWWWLQCDDDDDDDDDDD